MTTATPAAVTFTCAAGVRRSADDTGTVLWIQSPRTGQRLELFLGGCFAAMLTPRTVSRVVHANANGRHAIDFTAQDLKAFKAAVDAVAAARTLTAGVAHTRWVSSRR